VRVALAGSLILALVISPRRAWCEAPDAPTAEALFRAGRDAADRGDAQVACAKFEESYKLDPARGTLLNLATCEEGLGRLARAWAHLRELDETLAPDDDRRALVQERLGAVDGRLPRLTLELAPGQPIPRVLVDGAAPSTAAFGVPLPVDPGTHHVVVETLGRRSREYVVLLHETDRVTVRLDPGDPEKTKPTPSPIAQHSAAPAPSPTRPWAYASIGLAAGSLVTAGISAGLWLHAQSTVSSHCADKTQCDDEGLRAAGRASTFQAMTIATAAVSVVAATTGIILLQWKSPTEPQRTASILLSPLGAAASLTLQ